MAPISFETLQTKYGLGDLARSVDKNDKNGHVPNGVADKSDISVIEKRIQSGDPKKADLEKLKKLIAEAEGAGPTPPVSPKNNGDIAQLTATLNKIKELQGQIDGVAGEKAKLDEQVRPFELAAQQAQRAYDDNEKLQSQKEKKAKRPALQAEVARTRQELVNKQAALQPEYNKLQAQKEGFETSKRQQETIRDGLVVKLTPEVNPERQAKRDIAGTSSKFGAAKATLDSYTGSSGVLAADQKKYWSWFFGDFYGSSMNTKIAHLNNALVGVSGALTDGHAAYEAMNPAYRGDIQDISRKGAPTIQVDSILATQQYSRDMFYPDYFERTRYKATLTSQERTIEEKRAEVRTAEANLTAAQQEVPQNPDRVARYEAELKVAHLGLSDANKAYNETKQNAVDDANAVRAWFEQKVRDTTRALIDVGQSASTTLGTNVSTIGRKTTELQNTIDAAERAILAKAAQ